MKLLNMRTFVSITFHLLYKQFKSCNAVIWSTLLLSLVFIVFDLIIFAINKSYIANQENETHCTFFFFFSSCNYLLRRSQLLYVTTIKCNNRIAQLRKSFVHFETTRVYLYVRVCRETDFKYEKNLGTVKRWHIEHYPFFFKS